MNKQLEESIKELKGLSPSETAIDTVLKELERLQEENSELKLKERNRCLGNMQK